MITDAAAELLELGLQKRFLLLQLRLIDVCNRVILLDRVPYGDGESLNRLRERTEDPQARAAGATTLLDADIPAARAPAEEQQDGNQAADGQPSGGE